MHDHISSLINFDHAKIELLSWGELLSLNKGNKKLYGLKLFVVFLAEKLLTGLTRTTMGK